MKSDHEVPNSSNKNTAWFMFVHIYPSYHQDFKVHLIWTKVRTEQQQGARNWARKLFYGNYISVLLIYGFFSVCVQILLIGKTVTQKLAFPRLKSPKSYCCPCVQVSKWSCAYTKQHFRAKQRSRRQNSFKENTLSSVKYKALSAEPRPKAPSTLWSWTGHRECRWGRSLPSRRKGQSCQRVGW